MQCVACCFVAPRRGGVGRPHRRRRARASDDPGVVEDVHQIIGNLKTLTLTLADDVESAVLHIQKDGAGPVRAGDVSSCRACGSSIRPSHPDLHDDRDLNIELYVNKGRGYIEPTSIRSIEGCRDLVRIDSIYNPVRRANFSVPRPVSASGRTTIG